MVKKLARTIKCNIKLSGSAQRFRGRTWPSANILEGIFQEQGRNPVPLGMGGCQQELMESHGLDASDPLLFEETELVELSRDEALAAMGCDEPETLLQQMLEQLRAVQSLEPESSCVP